MKTFIFSLVAFVVGVIVAPPFHKKDVVIKNSFNQGERWSKWSTPIDTRPQGWYYERGTIQYRTNLDTGEVAVRGVQ